MPIKQCNAITIHKAQGATFNEKFILNCHKIFEKSMFYTALSRITKPENMKKIYFKEEYIKCDMIAFNYGSKGEYMSYFEKMLIANDEYKLNSLKVKSNVNMLEKNTIIYDFECATKKNMGHIPYFNHMIRLWKDEKIEEKTFMHYDNSENFNLDTFNYIMNIVKNQCDHYYNGKINNDKN